MRPFSLVPFGCPAPEGAIACDGLVEGAAIDLSHWPKNHTPLSLKADTSVEIALAFARAEPNEGSKLVVNNHFDTDGVLAVWSLLSPDCAKECVDVLVAAAEVGDFDEWPGDERGLLLDAAIAKLAEGLGDARAYEVVLDALDALVPRIDEREDLWGAAFGELLDADRRARSGALAVESIGGIAVLHHAPGTDELPGPVLSRLAPPGARRWLLAFEQPGGTFHYRYELPRYAWADTVRRPALRAPSKNAIAVDLGPGWALKGELGMTGLLRSVHAIDVAPSRIAERLLARDAVAR